MLWDGRIRHKEREKVYMPIHAETNTSGPRKHKVGESTQLQLTESDKFDFSLSDWDDWLEGSDSCESDRL